MRNKIGLLLVVGLLAVFAWVAFKGGIRVSIENVGEGTLTDVVVKVAGSEHAMDDVEPGATVIVKIAPVGTTKRVEVTWKDAKGRECYGKHEVSFEDSGYKGTISFTIDGATVKSAKDNLDTGFF